MRASHLQRPSDALKNKKIYMKFDVLKWGVTHSLVKNCVKLNYVTVEGSNYKTFNL